MTFPPPLICQGLEKITILNLDGWRWMGGGFWVDKSPPTISVHPINIGWGYESSRDQRTIC